MSNGNGREHTIRRLVVVILVVLAAMALAPSVASARSAPGVFVRPIVSRSVPAKPMYWKAMWLTRQHPSPVGFFAPMWLTAQHPAPVGLVAPMPALERYKAMRLSPAKLALLKVLQGSLTSPPFRASTGGAERPLLLARGRCRRGARGHG